MRMKGCGFDITEQSNSIWKCHCRKLALWWQHTSRLSSGIDGQLLCNINQDLLLCIESFLHLVPLLVWVWQLKLEQENQHSAQSHICFVFNFKVRWEKRSEYLFARWCRRSKYGLPVGPWEHNKADMKHKKIDHWKEKSGVTIRYRYLELIWWWSNCIYLFLIWNLNKKKNTRSYLSSGLTLL